MKKNLLLACILTLCSLFTKAQDHAATINSSWAAYASDTSLTYLQIVNICDSLYALAGYSDTLRWKVDTTEEEGLEEGGNFVRYLRWKSFWEHRCDSNGRLHDFVADALQQLSQQNKTTTYTNCAGTSTLQSSLTTAPLGWKFIGPRGITTEAEAGGNSLHQHLGQINDIVLNPSNPAEIYVRDQWGGVWKTINANLAPGNTWTSLTDHLPHIAGIGVTDFHVEFSSTGPNRLFFVLGTSHQPSLPAVTNGHPRTVGVFYSTNDGATFSQMDMSFLGSLPDNPIWDICWWPGNASTGPTGPKYMFVATKYDIYRVDVSNPASLSYDVVFDAYSSLPADGKQADRFRGFTRMAFDPADATVMYLTTQSNYGYYYKSTAGIYKITSCDVCSPCGLTPLPAPENDILRGNGEFTNPAFPYSEWYSSGWSHDPTGGGYLKSAPLTTASRVEVEVAGSYLHHVNYEVKFEVTLPPGTGMDVVLKSVHKDNIKALDRNNSVTPPTTAPYAWSDANIYDVGPGWTCSGSGLVAGHYTNTGCATVTTVIATTVPTTAYVNRLEFASYQLSSGYAGGEIKLDEIEVVQQFDDQFNTIAVSPATPGLVFSTAVEVDAEGKEKWKLRKIADGASPVLTEYYTFPPALYHPSFRPYPEYLSLSTVNDNIIYLFRSQVTPGARIVKFDLSSSPPLYPEDTYAKLETHPDVRCLLVRPNSLGTDDILYMGNDGGIAMGSFTGNWTDLNGSGLTTSWLNDIGSSIATGQVGIASTDNGNFWSEINDRLHWTNRIKGDGGQLKYGKSSISKSLRFEGYTPGGLGFTELNVNPISATPSVNPIATTLTNQTGLNKMANTYHGDFVGTSASPFNVYKLKVNDGTGSAGDPYVVSFASITEDASYNIEQPVQAIGADMNDPNYMVIYSRLNSGEAGQFFYSTNAASATPTWNVLANTTAAGGTNFSLMSVIVDPASHGYGKRLWAGASGYHWYEGDDRVFEKQGTGSWSDMSTGLPSSPINALVYDDASGYLFAGTDRGVYAANVEAGPVNSGNPWVCYSLNLPNMYVTGLDVNRCTGKIYASSYGRGAYEAELPPPIDETISGSETWNSDRRFFKSVTVPSGATLTIENCTVYFGKESYIKVQQGGTLIVNNATLTNECGSTWGGIQVWGTLLAFQAPPYQGQAYIGSGSVIEHARVGICNYNPDPSAVHTGGGIIKCFNTTFRNNRTAAVFKEFLSYSTTSVSAVDDLSGFHKCRFIYDNAYRMGMPGKHVMMEDVLGVKFYGCRFANWNTTYRGIGDGIHAVNSGFIVGGLYPCVLPPCSTPPNPSRFSGLTNGIVIKKAGLVSDKVVSIDRTEFDSVSVGVHIVGHSATSVRRSDFRVGRGIAVAPVSAPGISLGCGKNVGILAQNSTMFRIEDNSFYGQSNSFGITPWYNIGVYASNTSSSTKRVMRNTLKTLNYGVLGVGNNWYDKLPSGDAGLQVCCNRFEDNVHDIHSGGIYAHEGIGYYQEGPSGGDAGNVFVSSVKNVVNSNSTRALNYNHYAPYIPIATGWTPLIGNAIENTCASITKLDGGTVVGGSHVAWPMPALNDTDLNYHKENYYIAQKERDDRLIDLNEAIDGGNTGDIVAYIDSCSDRVALYDSLRAMAPYLSIYAVATAVVNAQAMEYNNVMEVLAANPDVLGTNGFLRIAASYMNMDSADIAMLEDTMKTVTARSLLEAAVRIPAAAMQDHAAIVLMALRTATDTAVSVWDTTYAGICLDTTSIYYMTDTNARYGHPDTIDRWLINMDAHSTPYERIGLLIERGAHFEAKALYNGMDTMNFTPAEMQEYYTYGLLMTQQIYAAKDGRSIFNMNQEELAPLDAAVSADDQTGSLYGGLMKFTSNSAKLAIWSIKDLETLINCPVAPASSSWKPGNDKSLIWQYGTNKVAAKARAFVRAYPNPSGGIVTFEYGLAAGAVNTGDIMLTITNVLGEKVFAEPVKNNSGKIVWDPGKLAPGVYVYQVAGSKEMLGMGKVVLAR